MLRIKRFAAVALLLLTVYSDIIFVYQTEDIVRISCCLISKIKQVKGETTGNKFIFVFPCALSFFLLEFFIIIILLPFSINEQRLSPHTNIHILFVFCFWKTSFCLLYNFLNVVVSFTLHVFQKKRKTRTCRVDNVYKIIDYGAKMSKGVDKYLLFHLFFFFFDSIPLRQHSFS